MNLARPLSVIAPTLDADVLQVLAGADEAFTGRQVAQMLGRSEKGTRNVLQRLCHEGVVLRQSAGKADLYRLNRSHLAAPCILEVAQLQNELLRRIRADLESWAQPPIYAAIFGSAARGDMTLDSDIDLFVVRPDAVIDDDTAWSDHLSALCQRIAQWTGNDARPFELGEAEVVGDARSHSLLLSNVAQDAIRVIGPPDYLRRNLRRIRRSEHA